MPDQELASNLKARLNLLSNAIPNEVDKNKLTLAFTSTKGNWPGVLKDLREAKVPEATVKKIDLTHSLAEITGDNEALVSKLTALPAADSLRSIALEHDKASIENLLQGIDI